LFFYFVLFLALVFDISFLHDTGRCVREVKVERERFALEVCERRHGLKW
jgi:hypothetical protein